jgi:hypothetical protein
MVPIGVTASNLVLGPARMYVAAFGAVEPADSAVTPNGPTTPPDDAVWTDVGGTDGGVMAEIDSTYTGLSVDQIIMEVGARLTELKMTVTAKLSEMTLENMNFALNQVGIIAVNTGYTTMDVPVGSSATQPTYSAIMIDGWAPYTSGGSPALRRIIVRKVLSATKAQLAFDKKTQQAFDCTWSAYFVSDSITPFHQVDQTA